MSNSDIDSHPLSEASQLRHELAAAQVVVTKYQSLLSISSDPAKEIQQLRDQVLSFASKCAELQEELDLLHTMRNDTRDKGKFPAQTLIQGVMEARPSLTDSDQALLRIVIQVCDRLWGSSTPSTIQQTTRTAETKNKDDEIAALRKENETCRGKINAFEMSLDTLTTESVKFQDEIADLKTQIESLIEELAAREEEIEELRPVAKEKYQLECEKQELALNCEKLKWTCEKNKQEIAEIKTKNSKFETEILEATELLEKERKNTVELQTKLHENEQKSANFKELESQLEKKHADFSILSSEYQKISQDLEDAKTELSIQAKKCQNEVKSLRSEIIKERTLREEMENTLGKCQRELQQLQDIKSTHARVAAASISEKKFVETLLAKTQELERTNQRLALAAAQSEEVKMELIREKQRSWSLNQELVMLKARSV